MIFSSILNVIEKILNSYLQLDAETPQRLAALAGKVIAIKFHYPTVTLYYLITKDGIRLVEQYDNKVDVMLETSPLDFLRLSVSHGTASIIATQIKVIGDTETAQQFKELFANLEIDWEEQLSHVTGDFIAHQIGNFFHMITTWAKQSKDILSQDLADYLHEEARLIPSREELQDFFAEIDQLRDSVDRLELRINRLGKNP